MSRLLFGGTLLLNTFVLATQSQVFCKIFCRNMSIFIILVTEFIQLEVLSSSNILT